MSDDIDPQGTRHHPPVSTLSLMGYLLAIVAWQIEISLLLRTFKNVNRAPTWWVTVATVVSLALTVFCFFRGRKDFQQLRHTSGRVLLTGVQSVLVVITMIAVGTLMAMVM